MINESEKIGLLRLAREAIAYFLTHGCFPPPPPGELPRVFLEKVGAFVTLNDRKTAALRGCIGHVQTKNPLWSTVITCAISAAVSDSRFQPIKTVSELDSLKLSISVMTPLVLFNSVEEIELGRHGVVLRKGKNTAVFLPEVPLQMGWNLQNLMEALCQKAGLSISEWKEGATFEGFESIKFSED